jgi:predicted neuraminidase
MPDTANAALLAADVLSPADVAGQMDGVLRPDPTDPGRLEAFLPSPCVQNHAANLMQLANGDIACVWFGGTMEGMGDISIYAARLPADGRQWSEAVKLSDDPEHSEQNPLLFNAPDGQLWLLHTSQPSGDQDKALVKRRVSAAGTLDLGRTDTLLQKAGTFVRQPLVVNGKGEWLLPVFYCRTAPGGRWRGDDDSSAVLVSGDEGRSWTRRDVPDSTGAVHMNILPAQNGRLVAFFRSRYADNVMISRSDDDGWSWTAPQATELPNNNSSIQAIRLKSGRIAIIYDHNSATLSSERRQSLYDEIGSGGDAGTRPASGGRKAIWGVPRAPLVVALSEDDGESFPFRRIVENGSGACLSNNSTEGLNRELSYPSIHQAADGHIHIAFTFYRRAIRHVVVDENWIRDPGHQMPRRAAQPG